VRHRAGQARGPHPNLAPASARVTALADDQRYVVERTYQRFVAATPAGRRCLRGATGREELQLGKIGVEQVGGGRRRERVLLTRGQGPWQAAERAPPAPWPGPSARPRRPAPALTCLWGPPPPAPPPPPRPPTPPPTPSPKVAALYMIVGGSAVVALLWILLQWAAPRCWAGLGCCCWCDAPVSRGVPGQPQALGGGSGMAAALTAR
jgi:hypothetical protein